MNTPGISARSARSEVILLALLGTLVLVGVDQSVSRVVDDSYWTAALSGILAVLVARALYRQTREIRSPRVILLGLIGAVAGYALSRLLIRAIARSAYLGAG